jgi:hypothetical protein
MKHSLYIILLFFAGLSFNFVSSPVILLSQPVAVVELFTSEGCSSCPAADVLLKEMVELTTKEGKSVIGLAFHVTYWNHLGWKDPYSQEEYTTRQKKYRELLNLTQLYTPQMVVNGQYEFVGSNPIAFREAVEQACGKPAVYQLDATAVRADNEITVNYTLDREPKSELLNIALVETSLVNKVRRGENKNRTLEHYNVVREFETIELNKNGEVMINIGENFNGTVILYIQHRKNFKVLGASKINLKP